jgi:hypothetical protein
MRTTGHALNQYHVILQVRLLVEVAWVVREVGSEKIEGHTVLENL